MPTTPQPYRGAVQVQGDDINKDGGYTHSWARDTPVTDEEGLRSLGKIKEKCNDSQKKECSSAFVRAENFIRNASQNGGISPESQPHSFQNPKRTIANARVDIEIRKGLTFVPAQNTS